MLIDKLGVLLVDLLDGLIDKLVLLLVGDFLLFHHELVVVDAECFYQI
jgi:hypothetical protein